MFVRVILALMAMVGMFVPIFAYAGTSVPFPVTMSEAVNVSGCPANCPRIAVDVGGITRYATYASGSGTASLNFVYTTQAGDVDLDGVAVSSPIDLNGGTITDLAGNALSPLTFTVPNTTGVLINHPSLSMDFIGNDYILNGTHYATLASFLTASSGTFTRASTATYFDVSGNLQSVANDTPRFDYDPVSHTAKGVLIEESRTNYVRNSQMTGLTVGTNSSAGNWNFYCPTAQIPGCTITVTGTGTQNGIPYIDLRFNIPTNSSGSTQWPMFGMAFSDAITVSNGNTTILSSWLGVTSYTATGGTCSVGYSNRSYTTAGAYITEASTAFTAVAPYAYRVSPVMTHGATAGKAYFTLYVATPNGVSCDVTVRMGGVQMELGSVPTSYIPTTGSTVTRQAEAMIVPTGSWFNASEGTLYAQAMNGTNAATVGVAALDNSASSGSDRISLIRIATTTMEAQVRDTASGVQFYTSRPSLGDNLSNKLALGYKTNDFRFAINNTLGPADTSGVLPVVNRLRIGAWGGAAYFDGGVMKIKYYPARVADAHLQLLTQ